MRWLRAWRACHAEAKRILQQDTANDEEKSHRGTEWLMQLKAVWHARWRFSSQELGGSHWVSVARGPLDAIVDAWGVSLSPCMLIECVLAQTFQSSVEAHFQEVSLWDPGWEAATGLA